MDGMDLLCVATFCTIGITVLCRNNRDAAQTSLDEGTRKSVGENQCLVGTLVDATLCCIDVIPGKGGHGHSTGVNPERVAMPVTLKCPRVWYG